MVPLIEDRLKNYEKKKGSLQHLRPASVLLPLYEKEGELFLLFTRRTEQVEHHKGQISFPGGMREPGDPDGASTALRETWEEVGIDPSSVQILGELDDLETVTGFNVSPFVGKIAYPFSVKLCEKELAGVFSVPLSFFLKTFNCRQESLLDEDGRKREFYVFQYEDYRIWGITAAITRNFVKVIT
ncbi:MAG: CoA pyrophosphatase [Nitrospirae bacterium]|nr:CoA pyrophosphatase [Nitrospirota bacterium]MBI3604742.1 CoA pyrophosphatase [Nitrospirota bacterium]